MEIGSPPRWRSEDGVFSIAIHCHSINHRLYSCHLHLSPYLHPLQWKWWTNFDTKIMPFYLLFILCFLVKLVIWCVLLVDFRRLVDLATILGSNGESGPKLSNSSVEPVQYVMLWGPFRHPQTELCDKPPINWKPRVSTFHNT